MEVLSSTIRLRQACSLPHLLKRSVVPLKGSQPWVVRRVRLARNSYYVQADGISPQSVGGVWFASRP